MISPQRWFPLIGLMLTIATGAARSQAPVKPVDAQPPAPTWLEGFRVRYPLRVAGNPAEFKTQQTVIARLPTGGWLKPDGSDVAVQSASGEVLPALVLSHD